VKAMPQRRSSSRASSRNDLDSIGQGFATAGERSNNCVCAAGSKEMPDEEEATNIRMK